MRDCPGPFLAVHAICHGFLNGISCGIDFEACNTYGIGLSQWNLGSFQTWRPQLQDSVIVSDISPRLTGMAMISD